jgi:hypothetical protein
VVKDMPRVPTGQSRRASATARPALVQFDVENGRAASILPVRFLRGRLDASKQAAGGSIERGRW